MDDTPPSISTFIELLRTFPSTSNYFNMYHEKAQSNNLRHYLQFLQVKNPSILLVGEAPGYKGCRKTGIPFTSGIILRTHPAFAPFRNQLQFSDIESSKENTAKIVFQELSPSRFQQVCLWNAFPFHPHEMGNHTSNRSPTASELKLGRIILQQLVLIFNFHFIGAIGRKAQKILHHLFPNRNILYIRHPSYGGKTAFIAGLNQIFYDKK